VIITPERSEEAMQTKKPLFPLKVSPNGRYFTDHDGIPFFWLGDTQWELFRSFSIEEARKILDNRAAKGFSALLVMLLGVGSADTCDGSEANVRGEKPWKDDDPLRPNAAYFDAVETIVRMAAERGIELVIGIYHARSGLKNPIQNDNARAWAGWIGERFRDFPNVIWSMYPAATLDSLGIVRELAEGLRKGGGDEHMISVHPDPSPASSSLFHDEKWLAFNTIQTFKWVEEIEPMVRRDYGLHPVKPVVMAEGAYEAGIEYGFDVTPIWVRRQAYYSYLAGASHSYGHNDIWRVRPTWVQALDAAGCSQLSILRKAFEGLGTWWDLVPDQSLIMNGGQAKTQLVTLAARSKDDSWAVLYLPSPGSVNVDFSSIMRAGRGRAHWINPIDGQRLDADLGKGTRSQKLTSPAGWEDALLLMQRDA
jgi:hypothetical protein